MSTLQKIHDQLHAKLERQANAVEITTQQLEDVRKLVDKENAEMALGLTKK